MVDEIFACEILLGHRSVKIVLVSDVTVEIHLGRHDRLACQVHAHCPSRNRHLAAAARLV